MEKRVRSMELTKRYICTCYACERQKRFCTPHLGDFILKRILFGTQLWKFGPIASTTVCLVDGIMIDNVETKCSWKGKEQRKNRSMFP
jgi:hypothetical protein